MHPTHHPLAHAQSLLEAGDTAQARQIIKRHLQSHPRDSDALMLLGFVERRAQHYPQAIQLLKKACSLAPQHMAYREQLATVQMLSNDPAQLQPAIDNYRTLLAHAPQAIGSALNLLTLALRSDQPAIVMAALPPVLAQPMGDNERLCLQAGLAIAAYLTDDRSACESAAAAAVTAYRTLQENGQPLQGDAPYYHIYAQFLQALLAFRHDHPALYVGETPRRLHIVAESHGLTAAHLAIGNQRVTSHIIMGAKAYFFTIPQGRLWQHYLAEICRGVPAEDTLLFQFGEIDCRANEGIMEQVRRQPAYDMAGETSALAAAYVRFLRTLTRKRTGITCIAGVPAPNPVIQGSPDLAPHEAAHFTTMIRQMNTALKAQAEQHGFRFVDIYACTVGDDGWALPQVHLDSAHLTPAITQVILLDIA